MRSPKPSELATLLFWLACSEPTLLFIHDGTISGARGWGWIAASVLFGATLITGMSLRTLRERSRAARAAIFAALLASSFVMVALSMGTPRYAAAATLMLAAPHLPLLTSDRGTWLAVGAIALLLVIILWSQDGVAAALGGGSAISAGVVFSVTFAQQALREHFMRIALAVANAELRASRELLAENSRAAERLRISRDLHDTLGHHLVALSIQLDVASRRPPELAVQDIQEAHSITRLLLADVRDVVATLRHETQTDAVALIRPLCRNIGALSIHLTAPEGALLVDAAQAEALVRCVQELITNALKHAMAAHLWIELVPVDGGITVKARDDGRGAPALRLGAGLTGMRERFAQLGGEVAVTTRVGAGFAVQVFLPTARTPA